MKEYLTRFVETGISPDEQINELAKKNWILEKTDQVIKEGKYFTEYIFSRDVKQKQILLD